MPEGKVMRLSKKGFNNVLIFSILTLIFIFNFGKQLLPNVAPSNQTVIDSNLIIVEIKTPDFIIKRSGRSWISEPQLGLSDQKLSEIVKTWQTLPLHEATPPSEIDAPFIIQIYTANAEQPIIVKLIQQQEHYLLQIDDITLFLDATQLPLFLGR